ncbi:MAG: hypothetical protein M1825_004398 [Sarcosagium campestre]|nr:MAG: hypothetical protein M1825_004398 [Sarcosagium campestre]
MIISTLPRASTVQSLKASARLFSSSKSKQATWGFVGLGRMGFPMAKNLRAKLPPTDTLFIHDLNTNATQTFAEEVGVAAPGTDTGVHIARNPREVAENADTVITVLPEPSHVKNVMRGILNPRLPPTESGQRRLFIDCSTIDPSSSKEVANAVHSTSQGKFVDAPMSGGVVGARAGTLTFMVGASSTQLERVSAVLSMMGSRIQHCGDQGSGISAKLANNYLLALSNIATAEAMNLGIKWGLDPKLLAGLINSSSGRCWSSEVNNPVPGVVEDSPASHGYSGGFGVSLMKKDLDLAIAAAQEAGANLELSQRAKEVYQAMEDDPRCKDSDFSVAYRYLGGTE